MEGLPFRITEEPIDAETHRVAVAGEIDLKTVDGFRQAVSEAAAEPKERLIVDLSDVGFIDSTGLGALVALQRQIPDRIVVVCPPKLRRIFAATGLSEQVRVAPTLAEALATPL